MKKIIFLFVLILSIASCNTPSSKSDNATQTELDLLNEKINSRLANAEDFYERGLYFAENEDYSAAIEDFKQALLRNEEFASAHHDIAICYYSIDMFENALYHYNRAIEIDDEFVEAYFNRSLLWDIMGMMNNAINDLNKVIELDSTFYDAYYNRGVYLLRANIEQACSDFARAAQGGIEEARITYDRYCF